MTPSVALLIGFAIIWLVANQRGRAVWDAATGASTGSGTKKGTGGVDSLGGDDPGEGFNPNPSSGYG